MSATPEYVPSTWEWVADQVAEYEASGGTRATTSGDPNLRVIIVTTRGRRTGHIRKFGLMRVERDGAYALVASKAGSPQHPDWYYNLVATPLVTIQDGPPIHEFTTRLVEGAEREEWWNLAVKVFPRYGEFEGATDRRIPVFVAVRT